MARPSAESAGLLLYRRAPAGLELFLAHPGGPFWQRRDAGAWTIPKGAVEAGETLLAAACREFEEETGIAPVGPFLALGSIRQKAGKVIHAWAWEGDADPRASGASRWKPNGRAARDGGSRFPKWIGAAGSGPRRRAPGSIPPRPSWWIAWSPPSGRDRFGRRVPRNPRRRPVSPPRRSDLWTARLKHGGRAT